jgi:hypothetical protein
MTACRQTDAIERRLARGRQLTSGQAEHARGCPACGATVAAAARLDASLPTAVRRMVIEPLPPVAELLDAGERRRGWRFVSGLGAVGAAAAGAAVIVVAILAGPFIGGGEDSGDGSSPGSSSRTAEVGAVPPNMAPWVFEADDSIWDHMDRPPAGFGRVLNLPLMRLERCGDSALAFFADLEPSDPMLYGIGNYRVEPFEAGSGGVAASLDETEAAYARTQFEPCDVVFDTVVRHDDALAAYLSFLNGDDRVRDPQILATKLVTNDIALAYVTEIQIDDGEPHQQVLVLRHEGGAWAVTGAQGGDLPVVGSAVGVTPLGGAKGMPDERMAAVGRTDDERVVAVELDFEGFPHRYPISGGAFVIQLPPNAGFGLPYRLIDADGGVVAEGVTQP